MPNTPSMSDPRELFLHELGDLLYAEKTLYKELPKLAQEASARSSVTRSKRTAKRRSNTLPTSSRSSS